MRTVGKLMELLCVIENKLTSNEHRKGISDLYVLWRKPFCCGGNKVSYEWYKK